jgi:CRISPR-associated protein Cmr4
MRHRILLISALTGMHNGAGEGLGVIDRPIIRERITEHPIIQSSSLKGVLRDTFEAREIVKKEKIKWFFGPLDKGSDFGGCISFTDATILAFPVRSLRGCFVWATSPLTLYRFQRITRIAGVNKMLAALDHLITQSELHSKITST